MTYSNKIWEWLQRCIEVFNDLIYNFIITNMLLLIIALALGVSHAVHQNQSSIMRNEESGALNLYLDTKSTQSLM